LSGSGDTRALAEAESLILELSVRVASFDDDQDGLLLEGTSALPSNKHISDSLIYGDYYYYEALQRLCGVNGTCW
jgi:unsaturated chondroitin disaccharide hydrolase